MDLLSAVIHLRSLDSTPQLGFTGEKVQGWFTHELRRYDPTLSAHLHENQSENGLRTEEIFRPYTTSQLFRGQYPARELLKNEPYWFRITTLNRELSELVEGKLLPNLKGTFINIGKQNLAIEAFTVGQEEHEWAGKADFTTLTEWGIQDEAERLPLEYSTPTLFHVGTRPDIDLPLPLPERVFRRYWKSFVKHSGQADDKLVGEFISRFIAINETRIRSERIEFYNNNVKVGFTGFVGEVKFALLWDEKSGWKPDDWQHCAGLVRALSLYAFFCGTGHRTTIGLGQTRLLPSN